MRGEILNEAGNSLPKNASPRHKGVEKGGGRICAGSEGEGCEAGEACPAMPAGLPVQARARSGLACHCRRVCLPASARARARAAFGVGASAMPCLMSVCYVYQKPVWGELNCL